MAMSSGSIDEALLYAKVSACEMANGCGLCLPPLLGDGCSLVLPLLSPRRVRRNVQVVTQRDCRLVASATTLNPAHKCVQPWQIWRACYFSLRSRSLFFIPVVQRSVLPKCVMPAYCDHK